jgi:hypothetical protein
MNICSFGCNQAAIAYFSSSGNWCCSRSANSCPAMRAKNSASNVGKPRVFANGHHRAMLGKSAWNRGLTKKNDVRIKEQSERLSERYNNKELVHPTIKHSDATKAILSAEAKKRGLGGYVPGSGRGYSGRYKNFWCDSVWELAFVVFCLDHKIPVQRNVLKFPYIYQNERSNYTPDFIIDTTFVEIKGYDSGRWLAKQSQFPSDKLLLVLYKEDLEHIFLYVETQYKVSRLNFYTLYEI